MEAKIFTIPFDAEKGDFLSEEFEAFCAGKRVLRYQPSFFEAAGRPWWSVWVSYELLEGLPLPKEVENESFSEAEKALMKKLKAWRREKAEKAGLPAYIIATNRQLTEMIQKRARTKAALSEIQGFGKKRMEAYSQDIMNMIQDFFGNEPQDR